MIIFLTNFKDTFRNSFFSTIFCGLPSLWMVMMTVFWKLVKPSVFPMNCIRHNMDFTYTFFFKWKRKSGTGGNAVNGLRLGIKPTTAALRTVASTYGAPGLALSHTWRLLEMCFSNFLGQWIFCSLSASLNYSTLQELNITVYVKPINELHDYQIDLEILLSASVIIKH